MSIKALVLIRSSRSQSPGYGEFAGNFKGEFQERIACILMKGMKTFRRFN